jgi:hypothetical protein
VTAADHTGRDYARRIAKGHFRARSSSERPPALRKMTPEAIERLVLAAFEAGQRHAAGKPV